MSATNPSEDQAEAGEDPPVKPSETETSTQIQAMDAEPPPEPGAGPAPEDAAPATEAVPEQAAQGDVEPEQPAQTAEPAAAAEETPMEEGPAEPETAEEGGKETEAETEGKAETETEGKAETETETEAASEPAGDAPAEAASGDAPASAAPDAAATTGDSGDKPRATRSRNPAFAAKQKNFIKDYQRNVGSAPPAAEKRTGGGGGEESKKKRKSEEPAAAAGTGAALNDNCCWVCHREGKVVCCETCPRVFHLKCAQLTSDPPGDWVCVECRRVVQAETVDNLSPAMKMLTHEQFTLLLKHAIGRLKGLPGAEPFITPVDEKKFPNYGEFVACPMDLNTMEENINRGQYGSTEAFIADCKWILHNCILFNGQTSKLTALAKSLLRMCKWEMEEIETCPDCYSNAYLSDDWFTLACPHPHMLIWARLKGFPYWPAKAVKSRDGNVDCRFFGRHDRAWVPIKECYLFSKEPPSPPKNRSKSLDSCIEELEEHIHNLEEKFGKFVHAKPRTVYDPRKIAQHIKHMLPNYDCNIVRPDQEQPKRKRTSDLQLDKLEKLRQQKKARRSSPAPPPEKAPADQPGPGAPGGPPELQPEEEDFLPGAEDAGERLEEMMEEMEEGPVDAEAGKAGKQTKKTQGKAPVGTAATATTSDSATVIAPPAAKETTTASSKPPTSTPKPTTTPCTPVSKPTPSPAPAKTITPATKTLTPATGTKHVVKAMTQSQVAALKLAAQGSPVSVKSQAAAAALASGQKLLKVTPVTSPVGGGTQAVVLKGGQGKVKMAQAATRANGVGTPSPSGRPRLSQQRSAGSPAARSAAGPGVPEPTFVISLPARVGPMMLVPGPGGAGGAVANGALGTGPPEGATAAEAPPPPVHTGAVSEQLRTQANDLSELIRSGLDQAISELAQSGAPAAALADLRLQIQRLQWRHQMELSEQKKVTDTMLAELRSSMEIEQKKAANKLTAAFASERAEWSRVTELRVAEAKKKQWCATCGREAIFYCCWNTSYCDFPCQEAQWPKHMLTCANQQTGGGQPAAEEPGEPQQPEQQLQEQLQPVQQQLEA